jgi:foldase protein PrsA
VQRGGVSGVVSVADVARAVAFTACVCLGACSGKDVLVSVGNQDITKAQLEEKLYASPTAELMLQQMVKSIALTQYAQQHGITVTDGQIAEKEALLSDQYPKGEWKAAMAARGLMDDDIKTALRAQMILEEAVGQDIRISEAQIRDYYDLNRGRFRHNGSVMTLAMARDQIVSELRRKAEGPLIASFSAKLLKSAAIQPHDPRFSTLFDDK